MKSSHLRSGWGCNWFGVGLDNHFPNPHCLSWGRRSPASRVLCSSPPWNGVVWIGTCHTKISPRIVQNSARGCQGDGCWFCGTTESSRDVTLVWWFRLHALGCLRVSPRASLHQLNNLRCLKSSVCICKTCLMELFQDGVNKCT